MRFPPTEHFGRWKDAKKKREGKKKQIKTSFHLFGQESFNVSAPAKQVYLHFKDRCVEENRGSGCNHFVFLGCIFVFDGNSHVLQHVDPLHTCCIDFPFALATDGVFRDADTRMKGCWIPNLPDSYQDQMSYVNILNSVIPDEQGMNGTRPCLFRSRMSA